LNGEKSLRGKYRVRFYDGKEKRWVTVTVDDLIPCYKGTKNPIFMQPHNNEFWPLIVEKAMAKFMGSYAALDGGFGTWATHALTGDNVFLLKKRTDVERTWRRHNMKFIGKPGDGGKKDRIYHEEVEENIVRDKLFNILTQYDRIRSLIAVSRMTKDGESKDEATGLVSGHLFSVISVRTIVATACFGWSLTIFASTSTKSRCATERQSATCRSGTIKIKNIVVH
jgi:calpain-15